MFYRAREQELGNTLKEYNASYQWLRPFVTELIKINSGTCAHVVCNEEMHMHSWCYSLGVLQHAIRKAGCYVTSMDMTHFTNTFFNGRLVMLVCKDRDNHNIPVAIGCCPTEDTDEYISFLQYTVFKSEMLREHFKKCTIISDRDKGLRRAIHNTFLTEGAGHIACTKHVLRCVLTRK